MTVYKETIQLTSHGKTPTFFDITPQVKTAILNSKIKNGICTVISPHTTCAVFFEEFVHDYTENGDEFLQADLNNILQKLIPDNIAEGQYNYPGEKHYEAVASWPTAEDYLPNGDRTALLNCEANEFYQNLQNKRILLYLHLKHHYQLQKFHLNQLK